MTSSRRTTQEETVDENLEGWFTDPFERHEARWFSAGTPTSLVRDGHIEGHDDPPDESPCGVAERIAPPGGPDSMRRADDAERDFDPERAQRRAWDVVIDEQSGQF
jgi:hypothetical protein